VAPVRVSRCAQQAVLHARGEAPPAGARLRRVLPLEREDRLPSGDRLVLLSPEIWSDWFDSTVVL
jgi:hypothetical protein